MSFLNSVLTSIGTGDASITPPPAQRKTTANPVPCVTHKAPAIQSNGSAFGPKRKAEQDIPRAASKLSKVTKPTVAQTSLPSRPNPPHVSTKSASTFKSATSPTSKSTPPPQKPVNSAPSKPPPKGSFADIMAKAKALQQEKPLAVGVIKHQTVMKERMSKAKRERLLKEAKQRELEANKGRKLTGARVSPSVAARFKDEKGHPRRVSAEPGYKGTARPSSAPAYGGTAGLPSRREPSRGTPKANHMKQPRGRIRDEYLGTDEEDEGDYYYGANDDYDDYSDASSDMEAGVVDMEEEEQQALRLAKAEDERELKAEMEAKKAKLERKKKLSALSRARR
ncbi:hypothetical protein PRK78_003954 [Emydomyces testavorans]|uniref:SPT2 chromatin protein n=1 Tax=Emydomyces testavorans TaxID=2070801 RepID=A0AAF0DGZ5_9EURO|nr:hypothetical protein PRK78_003954 [Emydomyces testavorans]